MFIRVKQVKAKPYAYLVENTWVKGRAKQRVVGYLGRVHEVPSAEAPRNPNCPPQDALGAIIAHELKHVPIDTRVDFEKKTVTTDEKPLILSLNAGYLCTHTLQEVLKSLHARNEERPGTALAESLSRAGLRVPRETFIRIYLHHHP